MIGSCTIVMTSLYTAIVGVAKIPVNMFCVALCRLAIC